VRPLGRVVVCVVLADDGVGVVTGVPGNSSSGVSNAENSLFEQHPSQEPLEAVARAIRRGTLEATFVATRRIPAIVFYLFNGTNRFMREEEKRLVMDD